MQQTHTPRPGLDPGPRAFCKSSKHQPRMVRLRDGDATCLHRDLWSQSHSNRAVPRAANKWPARGAVWPCAAGCALDCRTLAKPRAALKVLSDPCSDSRTMGRGRPQYVTAHRSTSDQDGTLYDIAVSFPVPESSRVALAKSPNVKRSESHIFSSGPYIAKTGTLFTRLSSLSCSATTTIEPYLIG